MTIPRTLCALATASALLLAGCHAAPLGGSTPPVSGSASADDGWTTPNRPTSIATPAPSSAPAWSDSVTTRSGEPVYRSPPPPPPPPPGGGYVVPTTPYAAPCPPAAPAPAPVVAAAPPRIWSGCGLPCEDRISMWHVRAVGGYAWFLGEDPADPCIYLGADVGRTFCGCWGLDLFYRYNSGRFDRVNDPRATKDGGEFHHIGAKITYESSFGRSRFYWWAGLGPEYFFTKKYLENDSGFGVFGELGVGYVFNQNLRARLGVNVHGMSTDVTRENPLDDGESRWLWIVAPVLEVEFDF